MGGYFLGVMSSVIYREALLERVHPLVSTSLSTEFNSKTFTSSESIFVMFSKPSDVVIMLWW